MTCTGAKAPNEMRQPPPVSRLEPPVVYLASRTSVGSAAMCFLEDSPVGLPVRRTIQVLRMPAQREAAAVGLDFIHEPFNMPERHVHAAPQGGWTEQGTVHDVLRDL